MPDVSRRWSQIALLAIAGVAIGGALKLAAIAILPVVAALLLCLMFWPVRQWLVRAMPRWIAAAACCVVMVAVLVGVGGWGWYAGSRAVDRFEQSQDRYVEQYENLRSTLTGWGVPEKMVPAAGEVDAGHAAETGEASDADEPVAAGEAAESLGRAGVPDPGVPVEDAAAGMPADAREERRPTGAATPTPDTRSTDMRERLTRLVAGGVQTMLGVVVALVLTVFLAYLALVEGDRWAHWAKKRWQPGFYSTVSGLVGTWSTQTRRHFLAKTCSGLISGAATGLWLWAMGVPMPLVWAVLTLILNYVPNVGGFISGAPPTLLAIVELGWGPGLVVAAGLWAIETVVGNLIDPKLEGDFLKLSTFVVLASMVFWGWMWGVVGAVMSPVLTAGLWALFQQRERLLSTGRPITKRPPHGEHPPG